MDRSGEGRRHRRARKAVRRQRRRSTRLRGPAPPRADWTSRRRSAEAAGGEERIGDLIGRFAEPLLGRDPLRLDEADLLGRYRAAAEVWNACVRADGWPDSETFDELGRILAVRLGIAQAQARTVAVRLACDRTRNRPHDDRLIVVRDIHKKSDGVTLFFEEHDPWCDCV